MKQDARARNNARCILLAAVALVVSGCVTVPKQSYNKAANRDVHLVCVLSPPATREYAVQNLGHAGYSFGLIGGLIAVADIQSKTSDFTKAAQATGLDLAREYEKELMGAVKIAGYEAKLLDVERPKAAFFESYDNFDSTCDVYLDSTIFGGYLSASGTADYIPVVRVAMRAVKRATKEVVYQEIVSYGYEFRGAQAISIPADARFRFKDHPALMANIPLAVDGIRSGVPLVIVQISRDLAP